MKDTTTTCAVFTPIPQHFPVIMSETPCGPAATGVDVSGGNFRSTLVEPAPTFWPRSTSCPSFRSYLVAPRHPHNGARPLR